MKCLYNFNEVNTAFFLPAQFGFSQDSMSYPMRETGFPMPLPSVDAEPPNIMERV